MVWVLRTLLMCQVAGLVATLISATHPDLFSVGHIPLAIVFYLFLLFAQAFVMFYFIGVYRLTTNILSTLYAHVQNPQSVASKMDQIFTEVPSDLTPYIKKVERFSQMANRRKRKIIPWTMLTIFLGMGAFLMGGAIDTGMAPRYFHTGMVYGFLMAFALAMVTQWTGLGAEHKLLGDLKKTFGLSRTQM